MGAVRRGNDAYNCERCGLLFEGRAFRITTEMVNRWDDGAHVEDHLLCQECQWQVRQVMLHKNMVPVNMEDMHGRKV